VFVEREFALVAPPPFADGDADDDVLCNDAHVVYELRPDVARPSHDHCVLFVCVVLCFYEAML